MKDKDKNNELEIFKNQGKKAKEELFSNKWYKQIPNILTLSRGISPLIIVPLLLTGNIFGAIIAEGIFAVTDLFDGFIARTFKITSDFGKKLDTICDKIFAITLLLPLYSIVPSVSITVGLEILIALINSISTIKGNNPSSSLIGKAKTCLLSGSIFLGYLAMLSLVPIHLITFAFAVTSILQGGAALDYYVTDRFKDLEKDEEEIEEDIEIEIKKEEKKEEKSEQKIIEYKNNFPKENLNKTKKKRF